MVILASRGSRSQKFERGKSHDTNYRHRSVSRKMATDYDAPRKTDDEMSEDSLEELKARRQEKSSPIVGEDETEAGEGFELLGADLSKEQLTMRVIPRRAGEFTCMSCVLLEHHTHV